MSSIPYTAPYNSTSGADIDPTTGLPRKKKTTTNQVFAPPTGYAPGGVTYGFPTGDGGSQAAPRSPFTTPGFTPDYKALIDAALGPMSAQFGADDIADQNTRNQQLIRALGQFGQQLDLGSANAAFGQDFVNQSGLAGLLPQANQLAQQTTDAGQSYMARATKTHTDQIRAIKNALAAKGALQSGELGHQLQEEQGRYDTGQYDARLQVQDYVSELQRGYATAQRQRAQQLAAAQREEAARQAQLNPVTGAQTATWNGTTYVYPDGRPVPRELWPNQGTSATAQNTTGGAAWDAGINAAIAAPHDPGDVISRLLARR